MTKYDIRVLTMSYLEIAKGDKFLDIGAGTGSVSVQAAVLGADVTAIERAEEGIDLIAENAHKFDVDMEIISGFAPEDLPNEKYDKVFIGGSRGKLRGMFKYLDENLNNNGILVGNFIMLKNLNEFLELINEFGYEDIETKLIQSSSMDRLGLMKADNPIFIVRGVKK